MTEFTEWQIITQAEIDERERRDAERIAAHVAAGRCSVELQWEMCPKDATDNGRCRWHNTPHRRCWICGRFMTLARGCCA